VIRRTSKGKRDPNWTREKTRALFARYQEQGDAEARDELVESYLPLVRYFAQKFRNRGEPMDDLVQVGTIGLIKAIDRFDASRDVEFTTYATPTIVGELKRHFRDKGWAIRVPRRLQELSLAVNQVTEPLTQKLQRTPTIAEIAGELGVTPDDVMEAMESSEAYSLVSLDKDHGSEGEDSFSLLEYVGREDKLLGNVDDVEWLRAALKNLTPQEQRVLYYRFYKGMTQTEVARELSISQMQVSRLLRRSLDVLRSRALSDLEP
jgi:RNA polymerase sigma-B factor